MDGGGLDWGSRDQLVHLKIIVFVLCIVLLLSLHHQLLRQDHVRHPFVVATGEMPNFLYSKRRSAYVCGVE